MFSQNICLTLVKIHNNLFDQEVKTTFPLSSWSLWQMVCSTFSRNRQCCKKCATCQGRYFEKETITTPPQSSGLE